MTEARIGISRCLLGEAVRYDGRAKPHPVILRQLARRLELVPVCPEVEAGLGIPRPPVQLCETDGQRRLLGRDQPDLDVTTPLQRFCRQAAPRLAGLDGFIFKSRSPSCGLGTTPLFRKGVLVAERENGVFTEYLLRHYPHWVVCDERAFEQPGFVDTFLQRLEARREHHVTD